MLLNNKSIYSQTLETIPNFYVRHILPLKNLSVVVFFESDDEKTSGFYQIWAAKNSKPHFKQEFQFVSVMHVPFEYSEDSVGFINEQDQTFNVLKYKNGGPLIVTQVQMPSPSFQSILSFSVPLSDEHQPTYLKSALKMILVESANDRYIIVNEYLGVFESPTGDVCDDIVITSWTLEKQIGEAIVKKQKEPLLVSQASENAVVLYRIFSLGIQICCGSIIQRYIYFLQLTVPIVVNYSLNSCILKCFSWAEGTLKKEEMFYNIKQESALESKGSVQNLQIVFCMNNNCDRHPELLFVTLDPVVKRCIGFKNHKLILDSKGSMLLEVPWAFPNQNELAVQYFSNEMKSQQQKNKTFGSLTWIKSIRYIQNIDIQITLDFYFSRQPETFIEQIQENDEKDPDELQYNEIKLDQNKNQAHLNQHCFVPIRLHLFHYLLKTKIYDFYGQQLTSELLNTLLPVQQQKSGSAKKEHIKTENQNI